MFPKTEYCRTSNVTVIHSSRTKRSETFFDADVGTMRELLRLSRYIETIASEHGEHSNGRRQKRDTTHYLNDVVHEIQTELENLENSMDLDTSTSSSAEHANTTEKFGIKCFIEASGKVNCSSVIYENEKSWKKSRDQVDLLIQVLKTKIIELKDIRRHLKEHKPKNVTDSSDDEGEEDVSENALSSTEDSDETTEKAVIVQKQSRRPHHNANTNHTNKRPHRVHSTTAAMPSSSSTATTTTTTTLTTSKPRSTTMRIKITSTASAENRTHPIVARKNHQNVRNSTAPIKTLNVENAHRHHHQHHAKISNTSHPTKRKIPENSTQEPVAVDTKSEKRHKFEEKIDLDVDHSRAECFCEPDTERWVSFELYPFFHRLYVIWSMSSAAMIPRKKMWLKKLDVNWKRNVSERRNENVIRKFASKRSASPNEWIASGAHCSSLTRRRGGGVHSLLRNKFQPKKNVFFPYSHDSNHWKTAPTWNDEPFCFCMNANNNTYSCVRTINQTHNFLYCEFTTGLVTFYNLRIGWYNH